MSGAQSDRAAAQIDALDGESMLGLLDDSQMPSQWKDEAFSEFYAAGSVAPSAMLRKGKWKLNHSHPTGCGETPFRAGLKKGGRRRIPTKESAV